MIILLSPAKTLDFSDGISAIRTSVPFFMKEAAQLVSMLKQKSPAELMKLMDISPSLAQLNAERFNQWTGNDISLMKEAVLAFRGDVYTGLNADTFSQEDQIFAQNHLRILSGLYGWLRPFDLIEPYRLEMGTTLKVGKSPDLHGFWRKKLSKQLKEDLKLQGSKLVINLASNEYFSAIDIKGIQAEIVTPVFKDLIGGQYKVVSFFAKKARGMMASYIIRNRIVSSDELIGFTDEGYHYNPEISTLLKPVFTRG